VTKSVNASHEPVMNSSVDGVQYFFPRSSEANGCVYDLPRNRNMEDVKNLRF